MKEEREKFTNGILFGFFGTNEDFRKAAPGILIAAVIITILISIFGCTSHNEGYQYPKSTHVIQTATTPSAEIPRIERVYNSPNLYYEIIKVDGHLYLANQRGGILHMETCPCKTNLGLIK